MNETELSGLSVEVRDLPTADLTATPLSAGADSSLLETIAGPDRPWLFGLVVAPSAVVANGVVQGGVLAFLLTQQGIGIGRASQIVGLLALPTSIYFLWSPITDFLLRRRTWLLLGAVSAGVLMAAAFREKDLSSRMAMTLIFLSACCSQLVVSSCGGMMGALRSVRSKRVAGSFYQCGSMAFGAAAVWVLLRVSSRRPGWMGAAALALVAVPGLCALAVPKQKEIAGIDFGRTMRLLWEEFKSTFLRWEAIPYTLMMVFPMASGSAIGLLPGVAKDYGVGGDQVGWMNGIAGALLMGAGSLAAAGIPARIRASVAYLSVGLVNAATLCVLWLGPQTPLTYYLGVTLYLFTIGAGYAMFTAVVLEFLGESGKSGSGRYSIINSLGNVPVLYMIVLDGWGGSRWGARGLSATDAVVSAVGATILLAYFLTRKQPAKR
jgi:MFS transporter, PAT family, beta-lactamase induction signal transducer AmpG